MFRFCRFGISSRVTSHGPIGPKGIAALAFGPLSAALKLKFPLGYVIDQAVARDVIERALKRNVQRDRADDDT